MAGASWILDKNRIASKIKSASGSCDLQQKWKSNPTKACPNCSHVIDNSDAVQEWPGLPTGVRFDPTDPEIIWHLLTKVGVGNLKPHPFIDEFIPTVENEDGICYTHPQNLPGVKQDGTVSHFFHRAIKAYNTGTRKRRKILGDDSGDVRWHKTGKTKPVSLDGVQKGSKKIMVLYITPAKGSKAEKTNWVMHQYHLGTEEVEKEGDYLISKIFYQQQVVKLGEKSELDFPINMDTPKKMELGADNFELDSPIVGVTPQVHPITPESVTPDPPCPERRSSGFDIGQQLPSIECTEDFAQLTQVVHVEEKVQPEFDPLKSDDQPELDSDDSQMAYNNEDRAEEEHNWWDSESQNLLNSQQLAEGLAICDEFLRGQSPFRDENENKHKPCLADYTKLGAEDLKKDLEECQKLDLDNIPTDTPPEFRLSQLDFNSQDSYLAWGSSKALD